MQTVTTTERATSPLELVYQLGLKQAFYHRYETREALHGQPHLTIALDIMETLLPQNFREALQCWEVVDVGLKHLKDYLPHDPFLVTQEQIDEHGITGLADFYFSPSIENQNIADAWHGSWHSLASRLDSRVIIANEDRPKPQHIYDVKW